MDRLFDEGAVAANETREGTCYNKFNIKLRTACGQVTEFAVIQSYTIQKVINLFLDNRKINQIYSDVILQFDGDVLQHNKTLDELDLQCGDVIDVHVRDNLT